MNLELTRLLTANNRDATKRLLGISAGVAVGVALFLLIWGSYSGMQQRELRSAWTQLGGQTASQLEPGQGAPSADQTLAARSGDYFRGKPITRVDVSAPTVGAVHIPGVAELPRPGTYLASPALTLLIDGVPGDQLGDRYGTSVGVIPDAALASPDSLIIIVGQSPEHLIAQSNVMIVKEFTGQAFDGNVNYLILAILGGIATLIPVLLLVSIVTGLGATQRRERFATLRLIGASPGTVARIAATETAVTGAIGAVAGALLAFALAPLAARVPIDGSTFFVADIFVDPIIVTVIVVGTTVATTVVAWWRAQRAGFGPLGTSRQEHERPPRGFTVIPLIVGTGSVIAVALIRNNAVELSNAVFTLLVFGGFILTTFGILIAGPYLTFAISRLAARYARSASGVVAFNRIRRLPRTTFRSVSGLVIALFLVTVFAVGVTTVVATSALTDDADHLSLSILIDRPVDDLSPTQLAVLASTPGVLHIGRGYYIEGDNPGPYFSRSDAEGLGLIPTSAAVASPAEFVSIDPGFANDEPLNVTDAPGIDARALVNPIVLIATDGTPAGVERARTASIRSGIETYGVPANRVELQGSGATTLQQSFAGLANIGILVTALISVISLAVATVAGILDRRRVFGLLRLMGMPVRTLRQIITTETALPLATVFGVSIALGATVAWGIVVALSAGIRDVGWPDPSYYVVVGLCLLLAALSVRATFRSAEKNTGIATTRYE